MKPKKTVHDQDCDALKKRLHRIEVQRLKGVHVPQAISVSIDLLECLLMDHDDLKRLTK